MTWMFHLRGPLWFFDFLSKKTFSREEMDLFPWLLEEDDDYNSFVARFRIQTFFSLLRISSQANHGRPCYLYLKSVSKFGSDLVGTDVLWYVFGRQFRATYTPPKLVSGHFWFTKNC
jgi:hypothetical protein